MSSVIFNVIIANICKYLNYLCCVSSRDIKLTLAEWSINLGPTERLVQLL